MSRDTRSPDREGSGNYARKVAEGYTIDLNSQAANWSTPAAAAARLWPTADAAVIGDGISPEAWASFKASHKAKGINGNGHGTPLAVAARFWPTATALDANASGCRTSPRAHPGTSLTDAINLWATPTSHERTHAPRAVDHGVQLANQVASLNLGPPAPASATDGPNSSPPTPGSPRPFQPNGRSESPSGGTDSSESPKAKLNPVFVEWMMNFSRGHTDLRDWTPTEPTGSAPSETPSSPHKLATPSPDSGAGSTPNL